MSKITFLLCLFFGVLNSYGQHIDGIKKNNSNGLEKKIDQKINNLKLNAERGIKNLKAYIANEKEWNQIILGYEVETPISEETERVEEEEIATLISIPGYVDNQSNLEADIKLISIEAERIIELIEQEEANKTAKNRLKEAKGKDESVKISSGQQAANTTKIEKESFLEDPKMWIPSMVPIADQYYISSNFGRRFHPRLLRYKFHNGIDLAAVKDTPIYATANGTVLKSGSNGNYGNYILIQHKNGFETAYAHLNKISVKEGATIKQGELLGTVGSTGMSTGNHLHYEIIKNKKRVNPKLYF